MPWRQVSRYAFSSRREGSLEISQSSVLYRISERKGKITTRCERRINVDQINLPGELVEERLHDEQVVSPDEFVLPTLLERFPPPTPGTPRTSDGARRFRAWRVDRLSPTVSMVWNGSRTRGGVFSRPCSSYLPGQTSSVRVTPMGPLAGRRGRVRGSVRPADRAVAYRSGHGARILRPGRQSSPDSRKLKTSSGETIRWSTTRSRIVSDARTMARVVNLSASRWLHPAVRVVVRKHDGRRTPPEAPPPRPAADTPTPGPRCPPGASPLRSAAVEAPNRGRPPRRPRSGVTRSACARSPEFSSDPPSTDARSFACWR